MSETNEEVKDENKFYGDARTYWSGIKPTVDGMLGGYGHISSIDIAGSEKFLRPFLKPRGTVGTGRAIDCGAGIGRITKKLLTQYFASVDMVEVTQSFLDQAKTSYLGPAAAKVDNYYCSGLETFAPEDGKYDVVWCQWVLGQLTDRDLVEFFQRCKKGLAPNGLIFVKENVSPPGVVDFDTHDSSYCRPKEALMRLLKEAGLKLVKENKQQKFPKELYQVWMFALQ